MKDSLSRISAREELTFIDLFAGCGGMSLGFQRAGFLALGGIEKDPTAAATYANNFHTELSSEEFQRYAESRDITKFQPKDFLNDVLRADKPDGLVDIIIGGPPCQAFARIGRAKLRALMDHPEAFLNDERANLYIHFLEYVEFFKPLAVVMENVIDIMNYGGKNVAEEIAASLDELGYTVGYTILNAAFYGVPQLRQRFYLIALRNEVGVVPSFPEPSHYLELPIGYLSAQKVALNGVGDTLFEQVHYVPPPVPSPDLPPAINACAALEDLPPIAVDKIRRGRRSFDELYYYKEQIKPSNYALQMREWPGFSSNEGVYDQVTRYLPRDYPIFERMKPGDQYPEAHQIALELFEAKLQKIEDQTGQRPSPESTEWNQIKKETVPPYDQTKFPNKWWKLEPNKPSRTLTAHMGKDTYSHIHYSNEQPRTISVREAARLQSFPDGFQFQGGMNAAFTQIGNAVPPLQAFHLAINLRDQLKPALLQARDALARRYEPEI